MQELTTLLEAKRQELDDERRHLEDETQVSCFRPEAEIQCRRQDMAHKRKHQELKCLRMEAEASNRRKHQELRRLRLEAEARLREMTSASAF